LKKSFIITQSIRFKAALSACRQLGGQMTEPENESELLQMFGNVDQNDFAASCLTRSIWVGIQRSMENKSVWKFLTNQSITYLPWFQGEPNGEITAEDCVGALLSTKKYHDIKCEEMMCFSCQFQQEVTFKLKGLCFEHELIDTDYIFLTDEILIGNLIFKGILGKTFIEFNKSTRTWNLQSQKQNKRLGFLNGHNNFETPVGKKNWSLYVQCDSDAQSNINLKLTKVRTVKQISCVLKLEKSNNK